MVAGVTANFGPFCSKDFSSGVSSFLESLITHLSWILEEVVFSLLLKIMFSRSVKVGSSIFCYRDVLVLAISVWRWLILIFVHLILVWMSEHSAFFIMACSNLLPFHLICKVFGVTLFAWHLRLKILAVLDLASCISSFPNCLASSRVSWL